MAFISGTFGSMPLTLQLSPSSHLELSLVVLAAHLWGSWWFKSHVLFHSDEPVVALLSSKTSQVVGVMHLLLNLLLSTALWGFIFTATHVPFDPLSHIPALYPHTLWILALPIPLFCLCLLAYYFGTCTCCGYRLLKLVYLGVEVCTVQFACLSIASLTQVCICLECHSMYLACSLTGYHLFWKLFCIVIHTMYVFRLLEVESLVRLLDLEVPPSTLCCGPSHSKVKWFDGDHLLSCHGYLLPPTRLLSGSTNLLPSSSIVDNWVAMDPSIPLPNYLLAPPTFKAPAPKLTYCWCV